MRRCPPWSIDHRCLTYHCTAYIYIERERGGTQTPLGQLIIDVLNTITLHIYIERERR